MIASHTKRSECLVCGSKNVRHVISLGNHPNADTFTRKRVDLIETPLEMVACQDCGHCQLLYEVSKESRYTEIEYSYTSSNSNISREHFQELAKYISQTVSKNSKVSKIVEPGCNDGFLLHELGQLFPQATLIGVDPCSITEEDIKGLVQNTRFQRVQEFFEYQYVSRHEDSVDIIVATNVLNHSDDPSNFFKTCSAIIKDNGYLVIEVPEAAILSDKLYFETIYHEHVNYFSKYSLNKIASANGFHLVDIQSIPYMCGSIRAAFQFQKKQLNSNTVRFQEILSDPWFIRYDFETKCQDFKSTFLNLIQRETDKEKYLIGLGASTKANTLLNFCGLTEKNLNFLTDVSPNKIGKYSPKSNILVQHPKTIAEQKVTDQIIGIPITVNIATLLEKEASCYNFDFMPMPSRQ